RWLALHPRSTAKERGSAEFDNGLAAFRERDCKQCHAYEGAGGKRGPDLTGYGDEQWLRSMIMSPMHPSRYGTRSAMPAFRDLEGPAAEVTRADLARLQTAALEAIPSDDKKAAARRKEIDESFRLVHLSDIERELIVRWLLGDHCVVFGGEPISGPPRRD